MYNVSDAFWKAIQGNNHTYSISGQIITDTDPILIDDDNISSDELSIDYEAVAGDNHEFGALRASILRITIFSDADRYGLFNNEIALDFTLDTDDGAETIPLGKWYILTPVREGQKLIIEAMDGSNKFHVELIESTQAVIYDMLVDVCQTCGVPFGMTRQQVEALPNGTAFISNDQEFVRDYHETVSHIGKLTLTIPKINRYGDLVLVPYGNNPRTDLDFSASPSSPVMNDVISDYDVFYTGLRCRMINDNQWVDFAVGDNSGLVMDLGDIAIASGLEATLEEYLAVMLAYVQTIKYTPIEIDIDCNPVYDIGDKIIYENGETVYIHRLLWKYADIGKIECVGQNPRLRVEDDNRALMAQVQQELRTKEVYLYRATNVSAISFIGGGDDPASMRRLFQLPFAALIDTTTMFLTTIPFDMSLDGTIELFLYIDSIYYDNSNVKKYCNRGANVVTMMNYIEVARNRRYVLEVYAKTYYEPDSDIRINQAAIATNTNAISAILSGIKNNFSEVGTKHNANMQGIMSANDFPISDLHDIEITDLSYSTVTPIQTVPTATIASRAIKAVVLGQGMAGRERWDGTLTFHEDFHGLTVPIIGVTARMDATDELVFKLEDILKIEFEETVGKVPIIPVTARKDIEVAMSLMVNYRKIAIISSSASSTWGDGYISDMALDGNPLTYWSTESGGIPGWLMVGTALDTVIAYSIQTPPHEQYLNAPCDFRLEGIVDDAYTVLDERTGIIFEVGEIKVFYITNNLAFDYYRLYIETNGYGDDSWVGVAEVELYGSQF